MPDCILFSLLFFFRHFILNGLSLNELHDGWAKQFAAAARQFDQDFLCKNFVSENFAVAVRRVNPFADARQFTLEIDIKIIFVT